MNPSRLDKSHFLDTIEIFSHLSGAQRAQIESISFLRLFHEGEIIFYEGEESHYFHFLIEGDVSVYKSSASTETIVIHHFRAPSLIAEIATLKKIPYPATCECIHPASVLKIMRDPFIQLLQNDPSLSLAMISSLSQKISALELSLERHSAPNAMAKVARLIRDDPHLFQRLKGIEISKMVGITPETLSRMLHKLKSEGIITLSKTKGINLISYDRLNHYCG
ncbi:MAG: Crp/Fnr family transcriptional regulator [Sulfuricurvum sp.]|nr:Crp/Fnr family transcriptional regulator [Sulfuricurvum sp.]